jgi:hypothetical protein
VELKDIPYTITYVVKKRMQIDNLNELPKEKRPPDLMIWEGTSEELESWIDKVLDNKQQQKANLVIDENKIEG